MNNTQSVECQMVVALVAMDDKETTRSPTWAEICSEAQRRVVYGQMKNCQFVAARNRSIMAEWLNFPDSHGMIGMGEPMSVWQFVQPHQPWVLNSAHIWTQNGRTYSVLRNLQEWRQAVSLKESLHSVRDRLPATCWAVSLEKLNAEEGRDVVDRVASAFARQWQEKGGFLLVEFALPQEYSYLEVVFCPETGQLIVCSTDWSSMHRQLTLLTSVNEHLSSQHWALVRYRAEEISHDPKRLSVTPEYCSDTTETVLEAVATYRRGLV